MSSDQTIAEPHRPYERPPLSKAVLKGEVAPDACQLHTADGFASQQLEAARVAREYGCPVTVLEAQDRLCQRTVPPVLSDYLRKLHTRHGAEVGGPSELSRAISMSATRTDPRPCHEAIRTPPSEQGRLPYIASLGIESLRS